MLKFSTLSIFVVGVAFGAESFDPGLIRLLTEANQQRLVKDSQTLCLPLVSSSQSVVKKNQEQDMNDCVIALCGMPENNPSVYITDKNFETYLTPEIMAKLSPLVPKLKKIFEKEKNNRAKMLDEIQQMLKDPNPEKWSPEFRTDLSYKMFAPYMVEKIDLKKPRDERLSVSLRLDQEIDPEFHKVLVAYRDQFQNFARSDVDSFLERGLYSEGELKEIGKARLAKLKGAYEKVIPNMSKFEKEDVASRIESYQGDLKNASGEDLALVMINVSNLEDQVGASLPKQLLRPVKPSCDSSEICSRKLKNFLSDSSLLSEIEYAKKQIRDPDSFQRQLNYCKAKVVAKLSVSSEKKKTLELVNEVKKQLNQKVFAHFSAHSRNILRDYFDNKIALGNTSLDSLLGKDKSFDSFKKLIDENLKSDYMTFPMNEEEAITRAFSIAEGGSEENLGICSPEMRLKAFDSYLAYEKVKKEAVSYKKLFEKIPPKDNIFISPFTCHHELRGKSIVAHELGHAINQVFASIELSESSSKQFKELRKCSTENYIEFVPANAGSIHEGDALHSEEDSADVFAYMTYPENSDLFSCALIRPALNNKSYDGLSLIEEDEDTHSTSYYRLIMEAIHKNKVLPVSCQRSIEPFKEQLRFKKCAL